MRVKILPTVMAALVFGAVVSSCQKDPSTSGLNSDYMVYTACDSSVDFDSFRTYYLPDSILLIGNSNKTEYWKDESALRIIGAVADNLDKVGYTRTEVKEDAELGMQLSYVKQVTYFVGYDNPYWWWYYPYYWTPGYWGDWLGWHYPYAVYYGYTSGSLLMELLDLEADQSSGKRLPVIWDGYIGGLLSSSAQLNLDRTLDAVDQAFEQSRCLNSNGMRTLK